MDKRKILILCKGTKGQFNNFIQTGIIFNIKLLKDSITLSSDIRTDPDIFTDISKGTYLKKRFAIIMDYFCECKYYIDKNGKLNNNYFNNITNLLQNNGIFIFQSPTPLHLINFAKNLIQYNNINPGWYKKYNLPSPLKIKDEYMKEDKLLLLIKKKFILKNDDLDFNEYMDALQCIFALYIHELYPSLKLIYDKKEIKNIIQNIALKYYDSELTKEITAIWSDMYNRHRNEFPFIWIFQKNENKKKIINK